MKKALLIAGAGTLGSYASLELLNLGYDVTVIALDDLAPLNRNYHYIKAKVDDALLNSLFAENHYDAIVDFIHYSNPAVYRGRADLLLKNTDQLVFLSSYRVYADEEHPIVETSPQILNVTKDEEILTKETYAIPKSINENYLRACGRKNWTIIRPLISFSHFRLDLVTENAQHMLIQAKEHKKLLLPEGTRYKTAGVGWSGNVGRMIAHLIGKTDALGEAFTLGTDENRTWDEVSQYYTETLGLEFCWAPNEDYMNVVWHGSFGIRCMLELDRNWDRRIDNSKVRRVTGLRREDFLSTREGLIRELDFLAARPDLQARFDTPAAHADCARMNEYIEGKR